MIPATLLGHAVDGHLAPVASLFADPAVGEVLINGPGEIWVETRGRLSRTGLSFPSDQALLAALNSIAQWIDRPFGPDRPILEAHLPDGSRLEAVLPPVASGGPVVAIRRFSRANLGLPTLVERGTLSPAAHDFLVDAVIDHRNVVVSGGTGSGKSSLLGALGAIVPPHERIVVLEDTRELSLPAAHVVYLGTRAPDEHGRGRVSMRDLLRATLRLRPDRIVVGEVRGAEALDLVQAMTSGHAGSLTTVHASSPVDALARLETMALMDETRLPLFALRAQVASAVDLIVQIARQPSGAREVTEIAEVLTLDGQGGHRLRPRFSRGRGGSLAAVDASGSILPRRPDSRPPTVRFAGGRP